MLFFRATKKMEWYWLTVFYQKRPTEELAHLAWCLLVAVKLSQKQGKIRTDLQIHMLIMQWLTTAQKRKLFPRSVAQDILWLLDQGKRYGSGARLHRKVEYIWRSSTGELAKQSMLFRFTYFIETLKTMGWLDFLLSQQEWRNYHRESATASAVYTPKAELHPAFSDSGELIKPLEIRFTGDISGVFPLLEQCHLKSEQRPDEEDFSVIRLLPEKA
ncbi:DUF2913 family protein [Mixta mediterraneensis]|uniref:DUF2913 family protein n=1 Tax=Mixta mediterraneensis TaxID=2758443 RepID=UPI001EEE356D|nr:DUF2913 family protein [Mixta mediterraneensis]